MSRILQVPAPEPGQLVDVEHSLLTRDLMATLRGQGLQVFAWTVNALEDVRRLRDLEVDGITTDYPAEVLSELQQGGQASSAA